MEFAWTSSRSNNGAALPTTNQIFKKISLMILLTFTVSVTRAREVALTFDDCPRKEGPVLDPIDRDHKIVAALKEANITAAFFCNSPARGARGIERIKYFADHGHLIANHTADHPDINKISISDFLKNIDSADSKLKGFPNFRKWFRFPFLREGKNLNDVEAVRTHLKQMGYTNGYVTIDTEDWYVDEILRKQVSAGRRYDESRLCQTYSQMMIDNGALFEDMSVNALGRAVKHVILLHETDLNAICLPTLISAFKKERWSFVTPDEAYRDPIALIEPKSNGKLNEGRLFALAKEAGYKGPYFTPWIEESAMENELEKQGVWK